MSAWGCGQRQPAQGARQLHQGGWKFLEEVASEQTEVQEVAWRGNWVQLAAQQIWGLQESGEERDLGLVTQGLGRVRQG